MRTRNRMAATAAALVLALGIGGCGGDDDDGGDDASTEGSTGGTAAPAEGTDEGDDSDAGGSGGGAGPVTIVNFAFSPDEVSVASGGTVEVSNEDGTAHTFTSDDAGFDETLSGGDTVEVTVDAEPGEYEFHCNIHPSMTGTITVE